MSEDPYDGMVTNPRYNYQPTSPARHQSTGSGYVAMNGERWPAGSIGGAAEYTSVKGETELLQRKPSSSSGYVAMHSVDILPAAKAGHHAKPPRVQPCSSLDEEKYVTMADGVNPKNAYKIEQQKATFTTFTNPVTATSETDTAGDMPENAYEIDDQKGMPLKAVALNRDNLASDQSEYLGIDPQKGQCANYTATQTREQGESGYAALSRETSISNTYAAPRILG